MMAAEVAMHEVRCTQRIWRREKAVVCAKLLLRAEDDVLTSEYAARVEVRCPNCGATYTLADFAQNICAS